MKDISITSIILFGLIQAFTHCIFMCGPILIAQITTRMENIMIENNKYHIILYHKIKAILLIPYHLGRVTSYSFLAAISSYIGYNIRLDDRFAFISSNLMLILAILFFTISIKYILEYIFDKKISLIRINKRLEFNNIIVKLMKDLYQKLSINPVGLKGYFLGIILGFIPCPLIYMVLAMLFFIDNLFQAILYMLSFGIATIFPMVLYGFGGYFIVKKINRFEKIFKIFLIIIFLFNSYIFFDLYLDS